MSELIINDSRITTCPTCGGVQVEVYPDGERYCHECGNSWRLARKAGKEVTK